MQMPSVEIRLENLRVETSLHSKPGRNVPTVFNAYRDAFEVR